MIKRKPVEQYIVELLTECFSTCFSIVIGEDAHLNPAATIPLMTIRKIKILQSIFYIINQILGAFIGSALVYFVYLNRLNIFDGGIRRITDQNSSADIFFAMLNKNIPHWNTFIDQVISIALLMIFIISITYTRLKIKIRNELIIYLIWNLHHMISEMMKTFLLKTIQ